MYNYVLQHPPGHSFFFTIRLADRHSDLLLRRIDDLRRAVRDTKTLHPFRIDAITVLPEVIHTIWTLPEGDDNHATRIAKIKGRFSRLQKMPKDRSVSQIQKGEKGIWQRSHWHHLITDKADFERHRDLIYLSPVHARLCTHPQDWLHTSLHRDQKQGLPEYQPPQDALHPIPLTPAKQPEPVVMLQS